MKIATRFTLLTIVFICFASMRALSARAEDAGAYTENITSGENCTARAYIPAQTAGGFLNACNLNLGAGLAEQQPMQRLADFCTENLGIRADSISDFDYSEVYTMVATAYTAGPESTGKSPGMAGYGITASGMRVRRGVIAVDPRIIPLGTHLYVKGYGYAIAADTGSAIKGHRIDVYMKTLSEAYQWGRRKVNVYILD